MSVNRLGKPRQLYEAPGMGQINRLRQKDLGQVLGDLENLKDDEINSSLEVRLQKKKQHAVGR